MESGRRQIWLPTMPRATHETVQAVGAQSGISAEISGGPGVGEWSIVEGDEAVVVCRLDGAELREDDRKGEADETPQQRARMGLAALEASSPRRIRHGAGQGSQWGNCGNIRGADCVG